MLLTAAVRTIVPGFIDAHCHILAFAASLVAADCSPGAVSSIADILEVISQQAARSHVGEWIRAAGYSEFDLREKRHPTRWELDRAAPNNPVRLNHRSGHACVLNTNALTQVGISASTEEPIGSTIARELHTAEPNGLLLDMDSWLGERIPPLREDELTKAVADASCRFISQGVTSVVDATPSNSLDRWETLRRMKAQEVFAPSLIVMPSVSNLDEFCEAGLNFGWSDKLATLEHAKIMLTRTSGRLYPSAERLWQFVRAAHIRGFPVAIHAVEADTVTAAAKVLTAQRCASLRDRIEHASECPPSSLRAILNARPVIVSQPSFIHDSGTRYIADFGADSKYLYRFRTLSDAGIVLAASSDAPVSAPNPLLAMFSAVMRRTASGESIGFDERLSAMQALEMHTKNAAYSVCGESQFGSITPGKRADFVVLSEDPISTPHERLPDIRVTMTMINGNVAWER